jgi:Selenocysteine lyase
MKIEDCRTDFPITRDLVYLDSAATSLTPTPVVEAMVEYDLRYRSNVGRGVHRLAAVATHRYRDARDAVRSFVGGEGGTLAVTRNTTEAIGTVAAGLPWQRGDRVVTTLLEHHSNLLPWLRLRERGVAVDIVRPDAEGNLDIADLEAASATRPGSSPSPTPQTSSAPSSRSARSPGSAMTGVCDSSSTVPSRCRTSRSTSPPSGATTSASPGTRCSGRPGRAGSGCAGRTLNRSSSGAGRSRA